MLLVTTPPMLVYPQDLLPRISSQIQEIGDAQKWEHKDSLWSYGNWTYDDFLRLFDKIESGELEKRCTAEELEEIAHLLVFLAKQGVLPDGSEESLSLDDDIKALLNEEDSLDEDPFCFDTFDEYQYMMIPAILNGQGEVVLCKSWIQKQIKHVKHFAKKHKKTLIIAAAVVVAATAVVVAVVATSSATAGAVAKAAGTAAAATAASSSTHSDKKDHKKESSPSSIPADIPSGIAATHEAPALKSIIDNQISSFKENLIQSQFFEPINSVTGQQGLSWEENGRALGSIFAHDSLSNLQHQIPYYPRLAQEVQEINSKYTFPILEGSGDASIGHSEIDRKFLTDYIRLYSNPSQEIDFKTLSYQVRGESALAFGYYDQAVQDLGKAIVTNPSNPIPYLERGLAHFGLGQYDHSLEDYKRFTSQVQQTKPPSVSEFSLGFAKGLPKGIYESGEGILLFLADFATHPIHTAGQMIDSVTQLVNLVRNDEWGVVAEALSPEMHELVTQWDTLPSEKKGELAGYALGKHGTDILTPGALAKLAKVSAKNVQELVAVYKNIRTAQETLVLEAAAGIGNGAKIAEVMEAGQKTAFFAEELGLTAPEMGQLKQAGKLETAVASKYEHLSLSMQQSVELYKRARIALDPYAKKPMPEFKVRELIHKTGIPTFPRPKGIPEDFLVMISDRGAGMKYVHPTNTHIQVRVMPGKLHSEYLHEQKPYVVQMKNGKILDNSGNVVLRDSPEAHIPLEEFVYKGE